MKLSSKIKWFRRLRFKIENRSEKHPYNTPHCDWCNVPHDEDVCMRMNTETDFKDWEHGLYPESCKYY